MLPRRIVVYDDPSASTLDVQAVAAHLRETTGVSTTVRGEFVSHHGGDAEDLARALASYRITDVMHPPHPTEPSSPLLLFERRLLEAPDRRAAGVLYDGFRLQGAYRALLPPKERSLTTVHVTFTSRLLGTFDEADRRVHARATVLGQPALVSTSGLVEGPAKPRGFYAAKRGLRIAMADARYEALKKEYEGRFLDYDDPRLTDVAKGYALQAVLYLATGDPFCEDPECVLFNAHWQEEMLHAQIASGVLCPHHRAIAARLRGGRRTPRR